MKLIPFTLVETATIALLIVVDEPLVYAVALVGFIVEHVLSFNAKRNDRSALKFSGLPAAKIATVAVLEAAVWLVWLALVPRGQVLAGFVLFTGLLVGHVFERNTVAGNDLLDDAGRRAVRTLDFTALETAAGIAWLALVPVSQVAAILVLLIGLYAEHYISVERSIR